MSATLGFNRWRKPSRRSHLRKPALQIAPLNSLTAALKLRSNIQVGSWLLSVLQSLSRARPQHRHSSFSKNRHGRVPTDHMLRSIDPTYRCSTSLRPDVRPAFEPL
jgi:hypothetical protein